MLAKERGGLRNRPMMVMWMLVLILLLDDDDEDNEDNGSNIDDNHTEPSNW